MAEPVHPNVLVACEETDTNHPVLEMLAGRGVRFTVVDDIAAAEERFGRCDWELVVVGGAQDADRERDFVGRIKADLPELPMIRIGAEDSAAAALGAIRDGYDEFLPAPPDRGVLGGLFERLLPNHDAPLAAAGMDGLRCLYRIAGRSASLGRVIEVAKKVAPTSVPVLIQGESGTGKELISYLVHHSSRRAAGPYIRLNCAGLSESLLESELFGHERGAFTGAYSRRKGRFELAHGGTLLLDEVSETGPRFQAGLLRVLETQDFERVGGSDPIHVNVRILSTTNRDLTEDVVAGRFRRDLFHRINGVQLRLPPLRERPEDIPVLVWHFINQYAGEARRRIASLDADMVKVFARYPWPGNVRQLRNVVRALMILGSGPTLSLVDEHAWPPEVLPEESLQRCSLRLRDLERQAILEALRRTNRHYTRAAALLGITDRTLREKLRRYRRDGHMEEAGERPCATESV
ncbi:MAG TPA: sigma-54 dependent transcriptional regulator [Phycisphaerae bacterium]|nr:sigma-54 dependent transcriptional regulator [Phycisphaerae bacterium]